jgi:hypothetical protein
MNFGTEFTELAATIGAKKDGKKDDCFLTPKQWALVIGAGVLLAIVINFFLVRSGI